MTGRTDPLGLIPDELLALASEEERREYARYLIEQDYEKWLETIFPAYVSAPLAEHHHRLWQWIWGIREGERPTSTILVLPRGGAKSTSAELGTVALGARRVRKYILYCSMTQDQADKHVANIATMLESENVAVYYPTLGNRKLGKYGNVKGWRRNRLQSEELIIDAIGLDTAARGIKADEFRPDLLVLDDIDEEHDSARTTQKKIDVITKSLIPAGSSSLAVLAVQNLVHPDSVFAQLVDGRADFLSRRQVIGPVPAVRDLTTEQRSDGRFYITGGTPTWAGQNLEICQSMIHDMGLRAFMAECQHDVEVPPGGMFDHLTWIRCDWSDVPELHRVTVWVDPAVTDKDNSDAMGIQADGLGADGKIYRLWSWEQRSTPLDALVRAVRKAVELQAGTVGVETDQGGETWKSVYTQAVRHVQSELDKAANRELNSDDDTATRRAEWLRLSPPKFVGEKAGAIGGKRERAAQMLTDYERGRIIHVIGTHHILEAGLRRFPETKPYDLVDAAFWSWRYLARPRKAARLRFRGRRNVGGGPSA